MQAKAAIGEWQSGQIKGLARGILALLICWGWLAKASAQSRLLPDMDSIDMLLTNPAVQFEATEGVDDLYNFKFSRAESQFRFLKKYYPKHPLPYYLIGLSHWWKIVPDINVEKYDQDFISYMDSSIMYAEAIFEQAPNNVEATFFLAAAYGLKARLHGERKMWTKAATAGKKALKYLEYNREDIDLSPELLFGDGLYNYYSVWLPKNYPFLSPLLIFFRKGDKELGLEQMERVTKEAFYTRVEAQLYLMRLWGFEENQKARALLLAEYLHKQYPDNPYFHRYYARLLYDQGQFAQMVVECEQILERIDEGMAGYEANSGRYASFFLGWYYQHNGSEREQAKQYFERAVQFAESNQMEGSGYCLYSLLELARYQKAQENYEKTIEYLDKVIEYGERKHSAVKKARSLRSETRKLNGTDSPWYWPF